MMADIWKKRVRELELGADVYHEVDAFFQELLEKDKKEKEEQAKQDRVKKINYLVNHDEVAGENLSDKKNDHSINMTVNKKTEETKREQDKNKDELKYREGQHTMALTIADALKEKQIVLVEAQVGIGKSYAYLIPLVYSFHKNPGIKGAVIATSTIALQEQLMKDIEKVAEILNIDNFEAVLVKGKNNYLCRKRVHEFLATTIDSPYQYILNKIEDEQDAALDRDDFLTLPDSIWKNINVKNCLARNCPYYNKCKFALQKDANVEIRHKIVVTNQDYLAQHLKMGKDSTLLQDNSVLIVDEAHNLEEKVRSSYTETIDKRKIEGALYHLYSSVSYKDEEFLPKAEIINLLNSFFVKLRNSAKRVVKQNSDIVNYQDCDRVMINCNSNMEDEIKHLIAELKNNIKNAEEIGNYFGCLAPDKRAVDTINQFCRLLKDLLKKDKATNLYWAKFLDVNGKYVQLHYVPKDTNKLLANNLTRLNSSIILTSATLSAGDDYQYYADSIGLNQIMGRNVIREFPISSPYDYAKQVLLYAPTDITNPKVNHQRFLDDIVHRISDLFEVTKGRSLVLFTSKRDMNYVYEQLKLKTFPFPIYLQSDDANIKQLKESFKSNISSCLLATGVFFEGIDIKGESLSSVIIPRLPFPIVDPVIDSKAKKYQDGFGEVYLPEMMIKLRQATGRLIRDDKDKGIISILDPRFLEYNQNYGQLFTRILPFTNMTSNWEEVKKFAQDELEEEKKVVQGDSKEIVETPSEHRLRK